MKHMTSEKIIERLLDEKKITVKEALIILKDLAIEKAKNIIYSEPTQISSSPVICSYGVTPTLDTEDDTIYHDLTITTKYTDEHKQ